MWCDWRNKGNTTGGKCIIISCAVSIFGKNRDIFMATICDMALGKIFLWNPSWLNKNRFHEKEGGQFLHTNGIYCVLLAINSSKQRKDNQCLARYRWCLLSVYHNIFLNVRSDRYSFINEEILYNKKGRSQTGHWADSIHAFLVFSVTRETLTYDVT